MDFMRFRKMPRGCAKGLVVALLIIVVCLVRGANAAERTKLDKAIALYQHESYEEALPTLIAEREANPGSPTAAYYLGLTYKRLQDLVSAGPHLEAAATLSPPVKEAIPELIDVLYRTGRIDEAKEWIGRAERESITPAQIAFLKGLVLLKEKDDIPGAIAALEDAEKRDPSLAKTVAYYKGVAYMQQEKFGDAKRLFREIIIQDPNADLAAFAGEYADAIARREKATKPFHGKVGAAFQYDDNVILKPNDSSIASGVGNEGDWRQVYTFQGDYSVKPTDYFGAKAGCSLYGAKQSDLGFYDTLSGDFSFFPAFYLDDVTIGFPVHYNQVRVNDKRYLDLVGFGTTDSLMIGRNDMAQVSFIHNRKYFAWPASRNDDDRDSREYVGSAEWFHFFAKDREGLVHARFALNYEDTKGGNYTYFGKRLTAGAVVPLASRIKWNLVGEYFRQDFVKTNTAYQKARHDDILTLMNTVSFELVPNCLLEISHTFTKDAASIGVFKYDRNIYSMGLKYEF